jgi:hypothetical protein
MPSKPMSFFRDCFLTIDIRTLGLARAAMRC